MKAKVTILATILSMVLLVNNVKAIYTFTSDDVEVVDGIIISCSYGFADRDIIIPQTLDGQTVIGIKDAAYNWGGLFFREWITSVILPSTLEKIGDYAFYENSLTTLTIPSSVKTIGKYAFSDNGGLNNVVFVSSSNILYIGISAFKDADASLTSITLPLHAHPDFINYRNDDGTVVTEITIFYDFYYANIPYTLTDDDVIVKNGTIDSCSYDFEFKNIIIPEMLDRQIVKRIANGAYHGGVFYNNGITDITFPESMEDVGDYSFELNNIVNINIPESVTRIGNVAFYENRLKTLVIPNTVTEIGISAFKNNSLISLTLPNSITTIENGAFYGNEFASLTIPSSVTTIGKQAFYSNDSLISVTLPNSLEIIEEEAFYGCSLESLTIPSSVKSIGIKAFYNDSLSSVSFESNSNIMTIDVNAFANNIYLTGISLPTHANTNFISYVNFSTKDEYSPGNIISDFSYKYYTDAVYTLTDNDVVVTNGIIQSANYDPMYRNIEIPDELDGQTVIGIADASYNYSTSRWEGVFAYREMAKVKLPSALEEIGESAFNDNILIDLTIPNSVTNIGRYAFKDNSIVDLVLSNSLSSLDYQAFYNNSIDTLIIPNTLTNIPYSAFYSNSIDSIFIPSSVLNIENYAFYDNLLTKVIFESNSNIRSIGSRAFDNNAGLTGIVLPTNNNTGFIEYIDENTDEVYYPEETIISFSTSYYSNILYTLTDDDVVVVNGIIESCSFDYSTYKSILIPEVLDGQTIIGISESVFANKELINVQLPSTLQTIGAYAFEGNELTDPIIPNSVTTIGKYAYDANSIETITLPSSIETINEGAFDSNLLDSINIPSSVKFIGAYAFNNNNLKQLVIPNSVIYIGNYAFYNNSIDSLYLPESLTTINDYAFRDNNLTKVIIPNSVISIGSYAFYNNIIDTLILSNSITNIGSYAFYSNSLDTLTLPNSVKTIGQYAFRDNELTGIIVPESITTLEKYVFAYNDIETLVIPSTVTHINDYAFYSNNLVNVTFESSSNIINVGINAFASNGLLASITMPTHTHPDFIEYINGSSGDVYDPGEIINDFAVSYTSNIPYILTDDDVDVTDGIIENCYYNFYYKNIIIPDTLDNQQIIGIASSGTNTEGVFYNKGIMSIELPTYLETIGDYAFNTNKLKIIVLPDSVKTIGYKTFYGNLLSNITIGNYLINIGDYAFSSNDLTSLTLPNSVTEINLGAFSSNELTSVTLGNAVTIINKQAFYNNNITSITIPGTITYIGKEAFENNGLTSLIIPTSVKTIETEAFNNNELSSVAFNGTSNISYIGVNAFNNNSSLTSITLPSHADDNFIEYKKGDETIVTQITDFTDFYYANVPYTLTDDDVVVIDGVIDTCTYDFSYRNIIIPETLDGQTVIGIADGYKEIVGHTTVYHGVFYRKGILSVDLPATLEFIGDYAFYFAGLKHVTIGDGVTSIGDYAFGYSSLTSIVIPNSVTEIGAYSFFRCGTIDTLNLGNSLQIIGNNAFYDNEITHLVLPSSLIKIGSQAFWDNSIDTLIIPNSVTNIGYRAFFQNSIKELTLGTSVDTIGEDAFYYNRIKEVNIPNSVIYIGNGAFQGHSTPNQSNDITSLSLGNSVKYIGDEAFYYCSITSVSIPSTVEYIGDKAFMGNELSSLNIPAKINTIGENAFYDNEINNVTFENNTNISYIGASAFDDNKAYLTSINLPTHSNPDFVAYYNGSEIEVSKITDFTDYYYADIPYRLTDDDVVVTDGIIMSCSYDFQYKNIIIPQTLDGQTVVGIDDRSYGYGIFQSNEIIKLQLPATLNYIGDHAFLDNSLNNLTLPNSITAFGRKAFAYNNLINVNISNSTKAIGSEAFSYNNLTNITIPKSVKGIKYSAFYRCNISSVTFENNSEITYIENNAFGSNTPLTSIQLPTNANEGFKGYVKEDESGYVTEITDFYEYYYADYPYTLTNDDVVVEDGYIIEYNKDVIYSDIVIPSTLDGQPVIGIADREYSDCIFCEIELKSVQMPSSLEYIGNNAFSYNYNLKNIVIPNSVVSIGEEAFAYNYDNNKIILGNSVETIKDYAFSDNNYVKELVIPETVISIGEGAFSSNTIDSLVIPSSVESIGEQAFYRNTLISVIFEDNSMISNIGIEAFDDNSLFNIQLPNHASNNLEYYYDASMNTYNEGDFISDFETSYSADITPYSVVFKDFDGTVLSTQEVMHGESATEPTAPEHTGYIYDGWDSDFDIIISDTVITAQQIRINNITYNLDGSSNSADNPATYLITDNTITLAGATKTNYNFDGWFIEAEFLNPITEIPQGSEGDIVLWAKYSIITYDITYNLDGGINNISNPVSYSTEDVVNFAIPEKIGHTFNGWYSDADFTNPITEIPIGSTGNVTVWAKFTSIDYLITYNLDGGENSALNPAIYTANNSLAFSDATKPYYNFEGWYTDAGFTNQITEITAGSTGDTVIYAKFAIRNYNITYNLSGGTNGIGNPDNYTVESDTIILADAVKNGYTFNGWYTNAYYTTQITEIPKGTSGDIQLYAKYTLNEYSINYYNGSEHSNPGSYTVNDATITFSDAVKSGYTFNGWYTDAGFTSVITEITGGSTGNLQLYAQFIPITYTITYNLDEGINSTANPDSYTVESELIILEDANKPGYTFNGWFIDSDYSTAITEIPQGSTENIDLFAWFTISTYNVTFNITDGTYAINNASVYFDNVIYTTDKGIATIEDIINGTYNYTIKAYGFNDDTGSVTVSENDVSLNIVLNYAGTGINEYDFTDFKIYPNPVIENLYIEFKNEFSGKIEIYTLSGSLLKIVNVNNKKIIEINTNEINQGVYLLKIGNKTFKMFKE